MVGGCHFQAFWVGSKPVRSNFLHIFGVRKKNQKKNFSRKYRFLSVKIGFFRRKIGFYRKKSDFIGKIGDFSPIFFFSDFSTAKSFPSPPKSDFSPKNRPISAIFCSLIKPLSRQTCLDLFHYSVIFCRDIVLFCRDILSSLFSSLCHDIGLIVVTLLYCQLLRSMSR